MKRLFKSQIREFLLTGILSVVLIIVGFLTGVYISTLIINKPFGIYEVVPVIKFLPFLIFFMVIAMIIKLVLSIKLYKVTGFTNYSILKSNILTCIIAVLIIGAINSTIVATGFGVSKGIFTVNKFENLIFIKTFSKNILVYFYLVTAVAIISISFKKNMFLGIMVLILGIISLNIVGITNIDLIQVNKVSIDTAIKIVDIFTGNINGLNYLETGIFSIISILGYREVLKRI